MRKGLAVRVTWCWNGAALGENHKTLLLLSSLFTFFKSQDML